MGKKMRRTYTASNGVTEVTEFFVSDTARVRSSKSQPSTPRKQEANKNQAAHQLGRILNENFTQNDLRLDLSFDNRTFRQLRAEAYAKIPKGSKEKKEIKRNAILFQAEQETKNLIRRLRGIGMKDFRYFYAASDMNGRTGEEARVHVHMVISGDQLRLEGKELTVMGRKMDEIWGRGDVEYEFLRAGSYNALAAYMIRQTRDIKNHKRYTCSKNMRKVEYTEEEIPVNAAPYSAPAGAQVEEYQHDPTNPYGMVYMRYIAPPKPQPKKKRGGHKRE